MTINARGARRSVVAALSSASYLEYCAAFLTLVLIHASRTVLRFRKDCQWDRDNAINDDGNRNDLEAALQIRLYNMSSYSRLGCSLRKIPLPR